MSNFWIEKFTDAKVMELCCGDGFNTYSFYCPKNVKSVIACDYLQSSIDFAKKNYTSDKMMYIKHNLYDGLPSGDNDFTNVVWDAAINYFPIEEVNKLFAEIRNSLSVKNGIFSGTVQYNEKGILWEHYKTNFSSEEDFLEILKKYFNRVTTRKELRGNEYTVYFAATNGDLI